MIRDNPAGVGAGNWWIVFPKYANGIDYPSAFESVTFRHPHNDYLWICAESGIGALICYIGLAMSCLYYAWKEKASWLFFGLTGYMVIAFFSASHERAFASIIFALFIAMSLKGKEVNHRNIMIPALILAMVVFGFRYRSSCWNKKLRITTSWQEVLDCCEGYSMFSSMTHTGLPYHWWSATANLHLGKKEIASDQFQTAYRYNPYNIHVINGYGVSLALQGDKAGAERQFAYSLSIWPDFEDAKLNLAKLGEMQ
jgi:tetratricopeptide (TPR) repeat protein